MTCVKIEICMLNCESNYTLCKIARWVKHNTMCKIANCNKLHSRHFLSYTLWKILHLTKNFYTTSGCDGCDKYEVWTTVAMIVMLSLITIVILIRLTSTIIAISMKTTLVTSSPFINTIIIIIIAIILSLIMIILSLDVLGRPLSSASQWADTSSLGRRSTFRTSTPTALLIDAVTIEVRFVLNQGYNWGGISYKLRWDCQNPCYFSPPSFHLPLSLSSSLTQIISSLTRLQLRWNCQNSLSPPSSPVVSFTCPSLSPVSPFCIYSISSEYFTNVAPFSPLSFLPPRLSHLLHLLFLLLLHLPPPFLPPPSYPPSSIVSIFFFLSSPPANGVPLSLPLLSLHFPPESPLGRSIKGYYCQVQPILGRK